MAKQVVGLFDNMQDAHGAVQELTNAGFTSDDISIVANNASGEYSTTDGGGSEAAEGAGAGAVGGAVLGGLGGLLVGLGALAIPGVGPVVAAGTLATTLGTTAVGAGIGAAAGGLVGALVGAGIPEDDANIYAEGIRRGGALVTVQASSDNDADRAADILDRYNVVDIDERGSDYRSAGWTGFNENDTSYSGSTTGSGTSGSGSRADSDRSEWSESSKVGTAGGTLAGAGTGAAIGSAGGPVGTVIGGVAGAVTGAGVGAAGDAAGEAASDRARGEDDASMGGTSGTSTGTGSTTDYDRSTSTGMGSGAAIGSATDYGTSSTTDNDRTSTSTSVGSTADYDRTTTTGSTGFQSGARDISTEEGEVAIPVVEEEIRVGTREVESGGVRVETRVEETPVNEQVTLREEQVHIERRPVDQAADASTLTNAFQEGTFEVRETDEQAVVQKQARVVEEVVIRKDVDERTETVSDTVRRTDVDVDEVGGTRTTDRIENATGYDVDRDGDVDGRRRS